MSTWATEQQYAAPTDMSSAMVAGSPALAPLHPPQPQYAAPAQHYAAPAQHHAAPAQHHAAGAPQAAPNYSFPTAGGGAHALQPAATRIVGYRRRVRWENIVPLCAVLAFLVAGALFARDFDQITGNRGKGAAKQAAAATAAADTDAVARPAGDTELSAAEITAKLDQASQLMQQGDYEAAGTILHPMLEFASRDAKITTIHDELDRREQLQASLNAKLSRQASASRWEAVLKTLTALERLRPLSASELELRTRATAAARQAAKQAARPAKPKPVKSTSAPATTGDGPGSAPRTPPGVTSAPTGTPPTGSTSGKPPAPPTGVPTPTAGTIGSPMATGQPGEHANHPAG